MTLGEYPDNVSEKYLISPSLIEDDISIPAFKNIAMDLGVDINDSTSFDDKVVREIHLPVDQQVLMKFRSQDVIHSAYLPHFNVQMNCVPGINTQFAFTPTKTTNEMREDPEMIERMKFINEARAKRGESPVEFDYVLLCNKICGSAHYNMQIKVIVETQEEYDAWLKEQETFKTLVSAN